MALIVGAIGILAFVLRLKAAGLSNLLKDFSDLSLVLTLGSLRPAG
jgi:hypothetical protein